MKLPYRQKASIKKEKIDNYLLNVHHSEGGPKAKFFNKIGYNKNNSEIFKKELLKIGRKNDLTQIDKSNAEIVIKYIIDGLITSPINKKKYKIRTVWSIEKGCRIPWLSTAYTFRV